MSINMTKIGSNTNTHDTTEAPDLHMRFSTHVQNTTYNIFRQKRNIVLETAHE